MTTKGWRGLVAVLSLPLLLALAGCDTPYNLPTGVTETSREVYGLHMLIFWVCVVIAVVVFGAMFYSVVKHRRSVHPKPADFHESTTIEVAWTIVPFIILIAMAIPAAGTLLRMEDTRNADLSVKVTGYQWKWHYEYMGQDVSFFSTLAASSNEARQKDSGIDVTQVPNYLLEVDNPLVLPVGKKVRFLITANDVIHAWWVPEFAVKKDAIPGYVNEIWTRIDTPGTYRGVCAELCGRDHGYMPIVVKAVPEAEYQAWLAQQQGAQVAMAAPLDVGVQAAGETTPPPDGASVNLAAGTAPTPTPAPAVEARAGTEDVTALGKKVYEANCQACHQANGAGMPPNFPSLVGAGTIEGEPDEQIRQVLNGKGLMPPFKHLSDAEIAAVVSYERTSWGNKGGAVDVQAVAKQRAGK